MSKACHHEAQIVRTDERGIVCPATVMANIRGQKPGTGPGVTKE